MNPENKDANSNAASTPPISRRDALKSMGGVAAGLAAAANTGVAADSRPQSDFENMRGQ